MKLRSKLTFGFGIMFAILAASAIGLTRLAQRTVHATHDTRASNSQLVDALEVSVAVERYLGQRKIGELSGDPQLAGRARTDLETMISNAQARLREQMRQSTEAGEVEVEDNGVGIAPTDIVRVFGHGFTTKKEGHGFGLHASASAARENVRRADLPSPGPGLGAIFTLRAPIQRPLEVGT